MKIAVTSKNRTTVSDHAGRCSTFWLYQSENADVATKQWLELPNGESLRALDLPHLLQGINVLITTGISSNLRYRLKQAAIQVVVTQESDPDRAVRAWLNGTLAEIPPLSHCTSSRAIEPEQYAVQLA